MSEKQFSSFSVKLNYGFALIFITWGCALIVLQLYGWLRTAEWQQVPLYAIFLSEQGQIEMRLYESLSPLNLVPSGGKNTTIEGVAASFVQQMAGLRQIVAFILKTPLCVWLFFIGYLIFTDKPD